MTRSTYLLIASRWLTASALLIASSASTGRRPMNSGFAHSGEPMFQHTPGFCTRPTRSSSSGRGSVPMPRSLLDIHTLRGKLGTRTFCSAFKRTSHFPLRSN